MLADQQDIVLLINGYYGDTIAVLYYVSGSPFAASFLHGIHTYTYRVTLIDPLGSQCLFWLQHAVVVLLKLL
jgi:hypothetical protein